MDIKVASFSGHESFPFRNTWLTKGVTQCAEDPTLFGKDDALVSLGVGKNMVRSIRHWCLATRMLEEDDTVPNNRGRQLKPTELGKRIFLGEAPWDPYLEDVATLWLIHYQLVTGDSKATTWYYAFNEMHQPDFTRHGLEQTIGSLAKRYPEIRASANTLARDIDVFIRTYVGSSNSQGTLEETLDCPLAELGLIFQPAPTSPYAFARGPKDTLPDAIFLFALCTFAQVRSAKTLTFDDLAYAPRSPGRVFKLDEPALAERLERLADLTGNAIQFSESAGLKQVLLREEIDSMQVLDGYYHGTSVSLGENR